MVFYVLGSSSCYRKSQAQMLFLQDENKTYRDIVSVGGPECNKLATVVKTRKWFEYALRYDTDWIAKTDDDVIWNPNKYRHELSILTPTFAYHGVMRWRMYNPNVSSVCGRFMHVSPLDITPDSQNAHSVHFHMWMEFLKPQVGIL